MNNNGRQQRRMPQRGYTSNFTLICLFVIVVLIIINVNIYSGIITENPDVDIIYQRAEDPAEKERAKKEAALQKELETSFVLFTANADDTKCGNLILVNNDFAYSFETSPRVVTTSPLVTFSGRQSDLYVVSYPARELMAEEAILAFNALAEG